MKTTNLDPTEYLHAEDLLSEGEWKEYRLTIKEVLPPNTVQAADKTLIDKPILTFEKTDKRMILGKINTRLAKCALGTSKVAEWVGKKITLHAARGSWFGQENVAALRIRVPDGQAKPFLKASQLGQDLTGVTIYEGRNT